MAFVNKWIDVCLLRHHCHYSKRNIKLLPKGKQVELFEEELTMLILHEVGHTLGLNHNMGATTLHNNKDVHNPEITYKEGLSASVMDYHAINIAPPGVEQGQFSDIKPGLYDQWAIEFAYTPNLSEEEIQKI